MVSILEAVLFELIALAVGGVIGVVIVAALTQKRVSDLEETVWRLYRASEAYEDAPAIREARACVWDVLRGS